jgi:protein-S-isoprenylcysteine O-methyltransferase Ste14
MWPSHTMTFGPGATAAKAAQFARFPQVAAGKIGSSTKATVTHAAQRDRRPRKSTVTSHPKVVESAPVGEMAVAWQLLAAACAVGALLTGDFSWASLCIAAPFLLMGGLLALAALWALCREQGLVTRGAYRWIRHPYFLGILLMLAGAIIMMRSLPALILLFPAVRITLVRARREEHNLALCFGDAYLVYRARVPFIFPLRPRLRRVRAR